MPLPVVSLRLVLTLPFVVGVSAATVVTVSLFAYHEQKLQAGFIDELITSIHHRANKDLQALLEIPHLINRLNRDAYQSDLFRTPQTFENYFVRQIQQFPEVSRIAWLTAQGGTVGVHRITQWADDEIQTATYQTPNLVLGPLTRTLISGMGSPRTDLGPFVDVRTRPAYIAATQGSPWTPVYATLTSPPSLAMAAVLPVRDPQGQLQGVFATDIYLHHLQGSLNRLIRETLVKRLILLDRDGRILVDSNPTAIPSLQPWQHHPDPVVQRTLVDLTTDHPDWIQIRAPLTYPLTHTPETVVAFPVRDPHGLDWVAVGWIEARPWQGPGLEGLSLGILIAVAGVIAVGTALSRSVSRSIDHITQQATSLALGHSLAAVPPVSLPIRELQQLGQALQILIGKFSGFFEQITNTIPGLVYLYDHPSKQITYVNSRLADLLGYGDPEVVTTFLELVHPEDRTALAQHHQALAAAADNHVWTIAFRLRHQDQTYRWLHAYEVVFARDPQGSPTEILGAAIDVTSTHQLQTDLLVSEQRFRTLLDNLNTGIVVHDRNTRILFHNPAALELLGLTSDQLLGKTSFDPLWRVVREDGSPFPPQHHPVSEVIATGEPVHDVVMGVYRPQESEPIWLSVNGDPLRNEAGDMSEILVSFADISVRVRAQSILKDHNLTLSSLARNSTLQLGRSLTLMSLSQKITEHLRSSLDEKEILQRVVEELVPALGLAFADIGIYDLDRQLSTIAYECTTLEEKGLGKELPFSHNPPVYTQLLQGIPFQLSVTEGFAFQTYQRGFLKLACPIRDEKGTWADLWCARSAQKLFTEQEIAFVQQIAADCAIAVRQARLYAAAQAQVKALEHLNYLKDDFVSTVSHELRTPLSTMKMALRLLRLSQAQSPLSAKQIHYLEMLEAECDREISIINDLLDLQRLAAFGSDRQITTIDVCAWIEHLAQAFLLRAQTRQQSLVLSCPPSLPPLLTDPYLLERVMRELLTNACKYTPPHETIYLQIDHHSGTLVIQVINTGVTIPPELLTKIFDKFYRIPSQDRWHQGGTGLGLALVKQMCQALDTEIQVHNRPDPAVVFTLTIPFHPPTLPNNADPAKTPPSADAPPSSP